MYNFIDPLKGEIAALTAAFLWAVSSTVYAALGQRIPPLQLNFSKGLIAIGLLLLTLFLQGQAFPVMELLPISFLLLSGVIGIGLGDTAYFSALNQLGARRTLLLEMLAPPLSALIALTFVGERLGLTAWLGMALTLFGVCWVIVERSPYSVSNNPHPMKGIIWALLAAIAQATGAVLSHFALASSDITPLWSTLLRLLAGTFTAFLFLCFPNSAKKSITQQFQVFQSVKTMGIITLTAFGSTYLGIWLQQTAFKFSPVGIAQTLTSTSPLFVLPIAFWLGEKISIRAVLGVLIALVGIGVLFFGKV